MMVGGKNEINQDAIALGRFSASLTLNLAYVTFRAVNDLTRVSGPLHPNGQGDSNGLAL